MTEYGKEPSYGVLNYSTPFGQHSQTILTKQWLSPSISGVLGSYENWNIVPVDAEAMWDALIVTLKPFLSSDYSYDLLTIFNFDTGINKFIPVTGKVLAVAGTGTTDTPRKAVQQTINMRSAGGQPVKLVFLDAPIGAIDFDKQFASSFSSAALALLAEFSDPDNAWSARDNTRPSTGLSATYDLNDALRKQYRMI